MEKVGAIRWSPLEVRKVDAVGNAQGSRRNSGPLGL